MRKSSEGGTLLLVLCKSLTCGLQHAQFNSLYEAAIDGAERAPLAARRIANIIEHLTWQITCYVSRGLFERHKVTFAWMLAVSILTSAGKARRKSKP